ncbi:hypothetical protein [Haploplasma modicum]|uniref:hypothetical protein n=1 Tax=Haploplasma modicum TaxID=2150 RepID=UPI00047C40A1|nr:hypothetical protein [Haploplasma modicum]
MDNLEQNNEISLYDLWIKIWKNKILIIIVTLSITLVGVATLYFINRKTSYVSNNFNYNFIGSDTGLYADGSIFDFRSLENEEFLTKIKNRNLEKFKTLNIDELLNDDKLLFDVNEKKDEKNEVVIERYFKINMPTKHFNYNKNLAKDFIKEIHKEVLEVAKEKNNSLNLVNYFDSNSIFNTEVTEILEGLTYDQIFYQIRNQYTLTLNGFQKFIDKYGQVTIDGVNIDKLQTDYIFWYNTVVNVEGLEEEVNQKNYIRNYEETLKNVKQKLLMLEKEIEINNKVISDLIDILNQVPLPGTILDLEVYNKEIEKRTIENVYLNYEKNELEALIAVDNQNIDEAFETFVLDSVEKMSDTVKYFNKFNLDYTNSLVRYQRTTSPEFEVKKDFNMPLMSVVILMIGGIIGLTTGFIKESSNKNKELN